MVLATGPAVDILVGSGVAGYLEFKDMQALYLASDVAGSTNGGFSKNLPAVSRKLEKVRRGVRVVSWPQGYSHGRLKYRLVFVEGGNALAWSSSASERRHPVMSYIFPICVSLSSDIILMCLTF